MDDMILSTFHLPSKMPPPAPKVKPLMRSGQTPGRRGPRPMLIHLLQNPPRSGLTVWWWRATICLDMEIGFTVQSDCILRVLTTPVGAALPFGSKGIPNPIQTKPYFALWDTGASDSGITQKVIDELGLKKENDKPIEVNGPDGKFMTDIYYCAIMLPNKVVLSAVKVFRNKISQADILIGMDIITQGDFALSHLGGKTCFSFRMPSIEKIDFGNRAQPGTTPGQQPKPSS